MSATPSQSGFTLVELVMAIVVMGVIAGMVAVFMKSPIDAYFATARRAGIADSADTTVRRMARDIRKALPNSIRLSGTNCIEFIPTKTGGRYRSQGAGALSFSAPGATSFNMFGDNATFAGSALAADQIIAAPDVVVVYNLGVTGADAYAGDNTSAVTSVGATVANETPININLKTFPLPSDSKRFHVVPGSEKIVSYQCSGGKLYRNADYAYTPSCPAPVVGTTPLIAAEASCHFTYSVADIRNALVTLSLGFSQGGEAASVYHEIHVDNTP